MTTILCKNDKHYNTLCFSSKFNYLKDFYDKLKYKLKIQNL